MLKRSENKKTAKKQSINPFENFLSAYCSDEWILLAKNYLKVMKFKKDQRIINEGDKVTGVYFINNGMVKIVSFYDKDNERILRLSNKGSLVGHRGLSFAHYPISAIALSDTEVTFIPLDIFIKLIKANPDFSLFLITFISSELKNTEARMKNMIHGEVITRIAYIICMLIDAFGYDSKEKHRLYYTLSRKEIANISGTTYESVIRNLTELEKKKLINVSGKTFIITREFELRKLAGI